MKKAFPPVAILLVLALTVAVAVQLKQNTAVRSELHAAQEQLAASKARIAERDQELVRLQQAQASFEEEAKALRGRIASAPESTAAPIAGETPSPASADQGKGEAKAASMPEQWAKMFKDPEMKKAMRTQQGFGI